MSKNINETKKGTPKKKILKWVLICLMIVVLAVACYGAYVFVKVKGALDNSTTDIGRKGDKSELREQAVTFGKDPISILLLGIEDYTSDNKNGRADTQIVMTLDPESNEINMITVPRDTRVDIENAGKYSGIHKINAAYSYGSITDYGAVKLQMETVEKLLDVPIDYYMTVNFDGFRDIVDALGGVTIDVKKEFWEKNFYTNKKIEFKQGEQHLSGEEALAFVRMRKRAVDASYSRDERQRQFLEATVDQVISAGTIFKVGKITDILGKNVKTDLTASEIYDLQRRYLTSDNLSVKSIEIKGEDQTIDEASYFIADEESLQEVSQKIRSVLKLEPSTDFTTNADFVQ
ncbi:LCP family protein [Bacillus massiliigorillae]|uniref:LCP family protein n=1 Tax=Bacillus massiliigorillae TaxID=1243664 RepID=UPI00039F87B7|nr:LCP family protein [Bacillus massiliigorillae]